MLFQCSIYWYLKHNKDEKLKNSKKVLKRIENIHSKILIKNQNKEIIYKLYKSKKRNVKKYKKFIKIKIL